ncbi:MAG TPA: 4-hydroxyphenylacetate 3-hydroxylase N-terminal domain-containing protein, partial [Dehalococcoidia bacterium]|nr:4-hydroxyphenylacetate 3-hydroxylase N-terminal domain-containing protein [Dehalococcoidia bacterium]
MAFRTPDEYLESIRDGRVVYLDGDVVEDVTTDPRTRDSAQSAADEFNRYHDPKVKDIFVMKDPETGEETDRFLMMPKSTEDLKARARAIDFAQETGMGRLGFLSDGMLAMRWVAPELGKTNPDYANAIETQFQRMRSENLLACIAMSDTKGDRSKHPGEQTDPDLYVRKVDEMPDGIVIRGMKAHISAAHLVNEMVVMPTKRMRDDEPEYSVCCLVSPGME